MLQQTRTIPIIFVLVGDPIFSGFVASLARPGGNVTGFTPIVGSLAGKWVELLKDIAPRVARVTLLFNPATATYVERYVDPFRAAAASLGVEADCCRTCPSWNPFLRRRHASQIVASSSYRMSLHKAVVRRLRRLLLAGVSPPSIGLVHSLKLAA